MEFFFKIRNGILLLKLFWPTVRKNCSSDWEKLLKFKAEGWEFAKILRSLEQFIQTVKGRVSVQGVESLWGDCRFIPAG